MLAGAKLDKAILPGAHFENADLSRARLCATNLLSVNFIRTQLCGADLTDATLAGAVVRDSQLDDADLTDAKLMLVNFSGSSLRRAGLARAVLFGAIFDGTDLSNADLSSALGLTVAQLSTAFGNRGTRLPAALADVVLQEKPLD